MRILLAFDKFKESMTAREACAAAARAIEESRGGDSVEIEQAPLTDGGEGFCEILTTLANGKLKEVEVTGPLKAKRRAPFGVTAFGNVPAAAQALLKVSPDTAQLGIVEMARASGLERVPPEQRNPWETTSRGTGELIAAATQAGVDAILLGIGGSATNDCGLGALEALGLELQDGEDRPMACTSPGDWDRMARLGGTLDARIPELRIACDVSNPLLGPNGSTAIYGPQKGLKPEDYERLEGLMAVQAGRLCTAFGKDPSLMDLPGAGAAGGIGFGLMAACGAELVPGFDLVSTWLDLETKVARAHLILTGEGRFDPSSLQGKGPGSVIEAARKAGKPVAVFAGKLEPEAVAALEGFSAAISPKAMPLPEALRRGPELLAASVAAWRRSDAVPRVR
ncbi:MAG: glycerate kinase [Opitutales bacterium]